MFKLLRYSTFVILNALVSTDDLKELVVKACNLVIRQLISRVHRNELDSSDCEAYHILEKCPTIERKEFALKMVREHGIDKKFCPNATTTEVPPSNAPLPDSKLSIKPFIPFGNSSLSPGQSVSHTSVINLGSTLNYTEEDSTSYALSPFASASRLVRYLGFSFSALTFLYRSQDRI